MKKPCGKAYGHPIIRQIVDRFHVGTPEDEVVTAVKAKINKATWAKLSPTDRAAVECEAKRVHAANMKLYRDVMTGRF